MRPDVSQKRQATKQAVSDLLADYTAEYLDLADLIAAKEMDLASMKARLAELNTTINSLKASEEQLTDEMV